MLTLTDFGNEYFTPGELACPCCGLMRIDGLFFMMLTRARSMSTVPFRVESCCRCERHNMEVGGKPNSAHIVSDDAGVHACKGVDLIARDSLERWHIVNALIAAGFRRIGIGSGTLVHVDHDTDLPTPRIWTYK